MMEAPKARGYLPIDGIAAYDRAVQGLVFGAASAAVKEGRVATVQALGGTGGLKIGADFLKKIGQHAQVLISDPSWENHRALFSNAGFAVGAYPYYDRDRGGLDFDGMLEALDRAAAGTIVVLHACCHNPTGYDLTPAQWTQVVAAVKARRLVPFLDMAYQGFGEGIAEDGAVIGQFLEAGIDFFVATSFSKSFSLYGERVGALSVVCANSDEAARVLSQLKIVIRTNYSNPPIHGAQVVAMVLADPAIAGDVGGRACRHAPAHQAHAPRAGRAPAGGRRRQGPVVHHAAAGNVQLFGTVKAQMQRLREEFGVYGVDSGRICVAALNSRNIDRVVAAIGEVL